MENSKLKLTLVALGIAGILTLGIFVFIRLSLVDVPETKCVKKGTQIVSGKYGSVGKFQNWNGKLYCAIYQPGCSSIWEFDPSTFKLCPTSLIDSCYSIQMFWIDKRNQLMAISKREENYFVHVLSANRKRLIQMPEKMTAEKQTNEGSEYRNFQVECVKDILYVLESGNEDLWRWKIDGDKPKSLSAVSLINVPHRNSKPKLGLVGDPPTYWVIYTADDDSLYFYDFALNRIKLNHDSLKISESNFELPRKKDKNGDYWNFVSTSGSPLHALVACKDEEKEKFRTSIIGLRASIDSSSSWTNRVAYYMQLHQMNKSENWPYPPTVFLDLFFDKNGDPILMTKHEGFFRLSDNSWKRISSPIYFGIENSAQIFQMQNKILFADNAIPESSVIESEKTKPRIIAYDLDRNLLEVLEIDFREKSNIRTFIIEPDHPKYLKSHGFLALPW